MIQKEEYIWEISYWVKKDLDLMDFGLYFVLYYLQESETKLLV